MLFEQDLVLTPLATAITILRGRFTLSDNPNPELAAVVMAGLLLSWSHWAAFSVLDPVSHHDCLLISIDMRMRMRVLG